MQGYKNLLSRSNEGYVLVNARYHSLSDGKALINHKFCFYTLVFQMFDNGNSPEFTANFLIMAKAEIHCAFRLKAFL
ncbi:MAG: hypothetical protein AAGI38_23665 [Bacteroidota bacterium]